MITNAHIYLAIAEEALAESQKVDATSKTPKPDGEPGFIIKHDPDQRSFKKSLIAIAFAGMYLEAIFYIAGTKRLGKKYADIDKKSYEEKLPYFGIADADIISAAAKFRKSRRDLTHEKAKETSDIKPEEWRNAQQEATEAVALVKSIVPLLFQ